MEQRRIDELHESARADNDLAVKYQLEGRFADADLLYKRAQAIWESIYGPDHPLIAQSMCNRSSNRRPTGPYDESERLLQLAMQIWDRHGWPNAKAALASESPLWADCVDENRQLVRYGEAVRRLRRDVEAGSDQAKADLQNTLDRMGPWFHDVQFTPTITSNPPMRGYPQSRWATLERVVPRDLAGKSVLDIGCNSGFLSVQMKKRNARRVVGIDFMPHLVAQSRFLSHWYEQPIELREVSAYDVEDLRETFDIVLFVGVLYHLKHPLYALEKIASVCKDTMYFQSVMCGDTYDDFTPPEDYPVTEYEAFKNPAFPKLYFIEKSFNGDVSNWWFATKSCLKAMLRVSGFKSIEDTDNPEILVCRKS